MSLGKVPKRRWRQVRYEQRAEHVGIHGNPESGNHPGTITLKESVEILTNPHTYHDQQKGGREGAKARHEQIQCSTQLHVLTELECNTRQPCKSPMYETHMHMTTQMLWNSIGCYISLS